MTEKPRFKRRITGDDMKLWNEEMHPIEFCIDEIRRCYALLEEAERMAEFYAQPMSSGDESDCDEARDFLEKLSK